MKRRKRIKYVLGNMEQHRMKKVMKEMILNQIGATSKNNQLTLLSKDQEETFSGFLFLLLSYIFYRSLDNHTALPNEEEMISIFELQRLESKSISQLLSVVKRFPSSLLFLVVLDLSNFRMIILQTILITKVLV